MDSLSKPLLVLNESWCRICHEIPSSGTGSTMKEPSCQITLRVQNFVRRLISNSVHFLFLIENENLLLHSCLSLGSKAFYKDTYCRTLRRSSSINSQRLQIIRRHWLPVQSLVGSDNSWCRVYDERAFFSVARIQLVMDSPVQTNVCVSCAHLGHWCAW